jgi:paraquat-inducible protein B
MRQAGGGEGMMSPEDRTGTADPVPPTGRRRTIWPNLVWGIPLAALVIVGCLGVRAVLNRGEVITVTFTIAAGAKVGETKVLYQGVEAGELTKIEPNADGQRLDFHLRLLPAAKSGLNTNARFWLIGANPKRHRF